MSSTLFQGSKRQITLQSIPQVLFQFSEEIQIPNVPFSFPAIPSAKYYYVSRHGHQIPMINSVGSDQEKEESQRIWYAMNSDEVFPLITSYAISRRDQIGVKSSDRPASQISLSMKKYLKQYPDSVDWFFEDRFQFILGQMKRRSISDFLSDFYRFPLNPEADAFKAARLIEQYVRDGDETPLRIYLKDGYVWHLADHPFGYYPIYELFFLLTRFASPPLSKTQLRLAERRNQTKFNSPERIFIDAIFHYEIYNINEILQIIEQIALEGPEMAGKRFETNNAKWINWADEYLQNFGKQPRDVEYIGERIFKLTDDLSTWTDLQIEEFAEKLKLELPMRHEYPTRYAWIGRFAATIRRFRTDV